MIFVSIYMIINGYYGQACVHYQIQCIDDISHKYTKRINNYFLVHKNINFLIKFFFSFLIDISIIYTLIVWSIYSTNIRLISSGITYVTVNIMIKFIHIQKPPENTAFYMHKIFSIFINYNKTSYSFYPMGIGLLIICGFEWKRNNNDIYFYFFIFLSISESLILIVMQGNYLHCRSRGIRVSKVLNGSYHLRSVAVLVGVPARRAVRSLARERFAKRQRDQ